MDKLTAYEDMKKKILEETLLPGQWLVERELCAAYDLSRTPIREILWKLHADGFLEQESNRGFMVRRLILEQIFEVFQMREAVEGMAVRLACRKGGEDFYAELKAIRGDLEAVNIDEDVLRGIALGRRLHAAIMEAARNGMMSEIYGKLNNLARLIANLTKRSSTIEKMARGAHVAIIDALLEREEETCERIMREHLRDTCRQVVEQFYPGMM